jgi:hypothetical protein
MESNFGVSITVISAVTFCVHGRFNVGVRVGFAPPWLSACACGTSSYSNTNVQPTETYDLQKSGDFSFF